METPTLYSLLQWAAADHSARVAVEFGDERLTYAELLHASSCIADALRTRGAEPGRRVAFSFRKSIEALTHLFGIIRTGAAYVPIDPAWPGERVAAIVADAGIALWVGNVPPPAPVSGLNVALISNEQWRRTVPSDAPPRVPHRDIANILYTSGSTGRPKGVEITTTSLLHFSKWGAAYFGLTPADRLANHAPYNFDLSTFDIFAAVRAGATMCPVPESLKMFPYQMAKFIADRGVSVWYSVPSALIMMHLRGRLAEHDLSKLRHVIFAGEVMPKPALQALAREIPHAAWTNLYGPTETNVCTFHRCTEADFSGDGPVPIGVPISETRVWVSGNDGRPIPDGESGELRVAGPTVTTGYFGDFEMTSLRCVPAPEGAGLCYRTGDRVRRRPDGVLMFEGRIDRMIKCRGHRIEPGEIEAALHRHPAVRQAAVVPLADPVFGNRLKACVAARAGMSLTEPDLIAHCRPLVPVYMMPDVWHFYDQLPETDRGKIDLQKLQSEPRPQSVSQSEPLSEARSGPRPEPQSEPRP